MIVRHVAQAPPQPWRNGGGVTRELLRLPAGASDDWTLRISVADIEADGPFSPFPGVTRWFAAVSGAGVRLRFPHDGAAPRELRPGDAPLRFDGEHAPECTLLQGPTRDLNVMVQRQRAEVLVTPASPLDAAEPAAAAGFGFFALRPVRLHGAGPAPVTLPALALAWCESPREESRAWSVALVADAAAIADPRPHALPGYWIRLTAASP